MTRDPSMIIPIRLNETIARTLRSVLTKAIGFLTQLYFIVLS